MTTSFDGVKDSGERRDFGTGSVRDVRTGKGRYDLLPPLVIKRLAQHYENGAVKYGDNNWKLGQPLSGYLDSGLRHAFNTLDLMVDEDHPAAVIWNFAAFIWTAEEIRAGRLPAELDDIGYLNALEGEKEPDLEAIIGTLHGRQVVVGEEEYGIVVDVAGRDIREDDDGPAMLDRDRLALQDAIEHRP